MGASKEDVQALLDARCAGCHTGVGRSGQLSLDSDFTIETVGVPAVQGDGVNRIEPGDHARSYLWAKLNGSHADLGGMGSRMPLGSGPFSAEDLDLVASYIDGL
ncbi:MAG: hypothetical protein EXR76_00905 [Myxococcales bacterium]|nr:hypothetical protein [Myxococcales bacterium]